MSFFRRVRTYSTAPSGPEKPLGPGWTRFWHSVGEEPLVWMVVALSAMWATERIINSTMLAIRGCPVVVTPRCACHGSDEGDGDKVSEGKDKRKKD